MKKEKIMTNIYFIITILFILSLFCVLKYFIFAPNVPKKENIVNNQNQKKLDHVKNEEVIEDVNLNSDLAMELKNKIAIFDNAKAGSYYGYFYQKEYLDIKDIPDDVKIAVGITQNKNFSNDFLNATYDALTPEQNKIKVIILSHDEIQEGINAFFGPNTAFKATDLKDANNSICGFSSFRYDSTRNVYMSTPYNCSSFLKNHIDSKVIKITKKGSEVEVTLKIAYIKYEIKENGDAIKYIYKDINDTNYLERHEILTDNSYNINNLLNVLDTYKFTFTLNSNNYYYFSKVEKI